MTKILCAFLLITQIQAYSCEICQYLPLRYSQLFFEIHIKNHESEAKANEIYWMNRGKLRLIEELKEIGFCEEKDL
jgi:hypothetical protein